MSQASHLANHIERTVSGPMWHGPPLGHLLAGVSHEDAAAHPIAGVHSIWELVLHIIAWVEISRERLGGGARGEPTPEEDWPAVASEPSADAWREAIGGLSAAHHALAHEVVALDDAVLRDKVPGREYSVSAMLHGVIEHGTYHGGQIAILKRALLMSPTSRSTSS